MTGSPAFNAATSVLGAPAITVPMLAIGGMPVGVQLIGHPHDDWTLTSYARWLLASNQPIIR